MKYKILHYKKDVAYGNIIWDAFFPMKDGKFPKNHPFADNPEPFTIGKAKKSGDDRLSKFRERGYFASCFPEGDGLSFAPLKPWTVDEVEKDVRETLQIEI